MKHLITILILLMIAGCSNHTIKEKLTWKDGELTYRTEVASWSLLSLTKVKDVHTQTLTAQTSVGEMDTQSDPNSIKAAGEASGSALLSVLKYLK